MGKVIRLSESQLKNIIKKVISEQSDPCIKHLSTIGITEVPQICKTLNNKEQINLCVIELSKMSAEKIKNSPNNFKFLQLSAESIRKYVNCRNSDLKM